MKISRKTKLKIWRYEEVKKKDQVKDLKIRDSTRICNSGRISGATDKGIDKRAHQLSTPEAC
jgi:hypothetical protein